MQALPNRAKVQIGLPLSDIDVKTEHFKNFIEYWDKVLNSPEYVENKEIINELRMIGVDYAQGYGIHKPEPWLV